MLENIFTGYAANDGTGDTLRVAFTKTNNNFIALYSNTTYVSSDYVIQETDLNKMLYVTAGVNGVKLYLSNSFTNSLPDGTVIKLISNTSASGNVTVIPNTNVSLYKSGNNISASRNVTTFGVATLYSPTSNVWYIQGDSVI